MLRRQELVMLQTPKVPLALLATAPWPKDPWPQKFCFNAATGNAFTTVFAGWAFTMTSWPNIIFLPAFRAGFCLVLIMQSPGRTNLPDFFTSSVPISAKLFKILLMSPFLSSVASANEVVRPPLVMVF
eukprot:Skav200248  [mRNA]  locus=scaffold3488:41995:42378:- [translate_table: standard]